MTLNVTDTVNDLISQIKAYEEAMNCNEFRRADEIAARAKIALNELRDEAWHSYHTSGTGAI